LVHVVSCDFVVKFGQPKQPVSIARLTFGTSISMSRHSQLILVTLFSLLLLSSAHAQRGMSPADTLRVATVADAQVSPDGERIVYTVTTIDGNETRTQLWLVRRGWRTNEPVRVGEPPAPLLPAGWTGATPRWSPDGRRIAFLSTREGQPGLYVAPPIAG